MTSRAGWLSECSHTQLMSIEIYYNIMCGTLLAKGKFLLSMLTSRMQT